MNPIRELMKRARPLVRARRRAFGPLRPSWSEEFETIATVLRLSATLSTRLPLSVQRRAVDAPRPDTAVVKQTRITEVSAGGVRGAWFERPESRRDRAVVYLHGGGYSVGGLRSHRDLIARLCSEVGARVLGLEYRLAPEHPFPAQLEDSLAALDWLAEQGLPASRVALAGESAGGGLTLSTLVELRDRGRELPASAALLSPWVDLEGGRASYRENRRWDFVTPRAIEAYTRRFVPRDRRRHPLAAPLHAELRGLPPILVQVGEVESLRDEGVELAARLEAAGCDATLEIWPDMIHAFQVFAPMLDEGRRALARAGAHLRRGLDDRERRAESLG